MWLIGISTHAIDGPPFHELATGREECAPVAKACQERAYREKAGPAILLSDSI
jgi:hypothetical protein